MPHIAEGLLHAHLDGALGPDEQLQWTAAERHLDVCADCRERLEEARELRRRARSLLGGAVAPAASGPGFEALATAAAARRAGGDEATAERTAGDRPGDASGRSAARSGGRAPWWRSTARLAWAASLVMAAGAGWIGHELLVQPGGGASRGAAEGPSTEMVGAVAEGRRSDGAADVAGNAARAEAPARESNRAEGERVRRLADEVLQEERAAEQDEAPADEAEIPESAAAAPPSAAEPEVAAKARAFATDRQLEDRAAEPAAGASCFEPVSAIREPGMPGPLGIIVLASDGTIRSEAGGGPLVGFWDALPPDSLRVRLTDGSRWFEFLLRRDGDRLTGTTAEGDTIGFRSSECPSM